MARPPASSLPAKKRPSKRPSTRTISPDERVRLLKEFHQLPNDALVSERYVAAYRSCSISLVQQERQRGGGILFRKNGPGLIRYVKEDVVRFTDEHYRRFSSTTEYPPNLRRARYRRNSLSRPDIGKPRPSNENELVSSHTTSEVHASSSESRSPEHLEGR